MIITLTNEIDLGCSNFKKPRVCEVGWYSFIDYYHFNPYVNNKYEVKDLFAPYEQYSKEECNEVVGTYHRWDYYLPRFSKDDQTVPIMEVKNRAYYAVNSLWIWKEIN